MGADFALAKFGDVSGYHNPRGGGVVGMWRVGAKSILQMQRKGSTAKTHPAQKVSSVKGGRPCLK